MRTKLLQRGKGIKGLRLVFFVALFQSLEKGLVKVQGLGFKM